MREKFENAGLFVLRFVVCLFLAAIGLPFMFVGPQIIVMLPLVVVSFIILKLLHLFHFQVPPGMFFLGVYAFTTLIVAICLMDWIGATADTCPCCSAYADADWDSD